MPDDGAESDQRRLADTHAAAKHRADRHVDVIADLAIVLDDCR